MEYCLYEISKKADEELHYAHSYYWASLEHIDRNDLHRLYKTLAEEEISHYRRLRDMGETIIDGSVEKLTPEWWSKWRTKAMEKAAEISYKVSQL